MGQRPVSFGNGSCPLVFVFPIRERLCSVDTPVSKAPRRWFVLSQVLSGHSYVDPDHSLTPAFTHISTSRSASTPTLSSAQCSVDFDLHVPRKLCFCSSLGPAETCSLILVKELISPLANNDANWNQRESVLSHRTSSGAGLAGSRCTVCHDALSLCPLDLLQILVVLIHFQTSYLS